MSGKDKSAAVLTIVKANEMTDEGRRRIARWMRRQANFLVEHGGGYQPRFVTRYLYRDNDDGEDTTSDCAEDVRAGSVAPGLPEGLPA